MKISIGKSRKSTHWQTQDLSWQDLKDRLSKTYRTRETVREYKAMSKTEQDSIKDVGGFVGGTLSGNRRLRANILSRSVVTLDADFACQDLWESATALNEFAMCCYSTHKHSTTQPRLRFIIPLSREVTPEEYEPISRRLAADLGIDYFDITTHEPHRLMYWPSTSADGPFVFESQDGEYVSPDALLSRYKDWHDTSEWPLASAERSVRAKEAKQQGDPTEKHGIVGLFCRTYNIETAIDAFLSDVYTRCDESGLGLSRYSYLKGSTFGGMVLYGDGNFSYSHHATDPAGGQLCNAFDLVRLHKFSDLDSNCEYDTVVTKRPSYKAMSELCNCDSQVKVQKATELHSALSTDFGCAGSQADDDTAPFDTGLDEATNAAIESSVAARKEQNLEWAAALEINKKTGEVESSTQNILLILENDENLKGCIAYNTFTDRIVLRNSSPWRKVGKRELGTGSLWMDSDDSFVRGYLERVYKIVGNQKVQDGINMAMMRNTFHPIRDYLSGLEWDGVPRAEEVLIKYMGADDSEYVRVVTKTWLTAAVARVFVPGIKFDNVLMLIGPQGVGKSTLGARLGKAWFSDTFSTIQGTKAFEQLRGSWIIEMGELSALRKSEVENVKHFISKCEDTYRAAYGRNVNSYPRQCVFYGTTNEQEILKDRTGNRRFWTVGITGSGRKVFDDLTEQEVGQIWAEVVAHWKSGEANLYLPPHLNTIMEEEQDCYMTDDPRLGLLEEYLDKEIPTEWDSYSMEKRREYYGGGDFGLVNNKNLQLEPRITVCASEIAYEMGWTLTPSIQMHEALSIHSLMKSLKNWKRQKTRRKQGPYGKQTYYLKDE